MQSSGRVIKNINVITVLLVLVLVNYIIFSAVYSLLTPTWEGPDERAHYMHVENATKGKIFGSDDYQKTQFLSYVIYAVFQNFIEPSKSGPHDLAFNHGEWPSYENRYYHGMEEAYPFSGIALVVHQLRIVSIAFGVAVLIFSYKISRLFFPKNRWLPLFSIAFISLIPRFVAQTSIITNDCVVWLFSTLSIYFLLRYINDARKVKNMILLSVFTGLAMITKGNATILYFIVLTSLSYLLFSRQIDKKSFLKNVTLFGAISFPSLAWGTLQRGVIYVFSHSLHTEGYSSGLSSPNIYERVYEMNWGWLGADVLRISQSYISDAVYIMTILTLTGLFLVFVKKVPISDSTFSKNQILILFSSIFFALVPLFGWLYYESGGSIRYSYPVVSIFGVLFTIGLYALVDRKYLRILLIFPIIVLIMLNLNLIDGMNNQWYNLTVFYKNPFTALLNVYNSRVDLQNVFPEVHDNQDFSNLIHWASEHGIHEEPSLRNIEPLVVLLKIYYSQPDLQKEFPEVKDKHEIKNLVKWATDIGVVKESNFVNYKEYFTKYYQNIK